ncbi:MAG: pyridoxamine 5'-phosphate oxidase family protein [Candidatus Colwellbacteria bacterium]|nr:pyridoxamine 5'-phosphate oxidase family protein [Candidatus Colwellbacteria bacterium]
MKNWKDNFKKGKEIVFVTASESGIPNANIVVAVGLVDGKILVADCQMKTTIKNLRKNNRVCVLGGYYRVKGKAKIFSSGPYFDLCEKSSGGYKVKNAILITINKVFNLNSGKEVSL